MIYCAERKIGVFCNPKTGSSSLFEAFKNVNVTLKKHTHINYTTAVDAYQLPDFDKYKFFCFYRDPVSRFNSAFKYLKRETFGIALTKFSTNEEFIKAHKQIQKKIYDDYLFANKYYPGRYFWLSDETRAILESITLDQVLDFVPEPGVVPNITDGNTGLSFQKTWFDHDIDITYLNFANFDNELRKLLLFFDTTLDTVPYVNETIRLDTDVPFTAEERNLIMQKYQIDYDFFASKGITF